MVPMPSEKELLGIVCLIFAVGAVVGAGIMGLIWWGLGR